MLNHYINRKWFFFSVLDGGFAQIFEQISVYNSKDT